MVPPKETLILKNPQPCSAGINGERNDSKSTVEKQVNSICNNGKKRSLLLAYLYHHLFLMSLHFMLGSRGEQILNPCVKKQNSIE